MRYIVSLSALFSIFMILCVLPAESTDTAVHNIRIGLVNRNANCKSISISGRSKLQIDSYSSSPASISIPENQDCLITISESNIAAGRTTALLKPIAERVTVRSADITNPVQIKYNDGTIRKYFGVLEISIKNGNLSLVNVVDIETYLKGVVANEMQSKSPIAALKAQSICARSYAYKNLLRHGFDGYDLCDGTHCQVYNGAGSHNSATDTAVLQTAGMVITYKNQLASVMYSSDSGGVTQDYAELRGTSMYPYLKAVIDPPDIPRRNWSAKYHLNDISSRLVASGIRAAKDLVSIEVDQVGTGGRVLTISIVSLNGITSISADRLRSALGINQLKSTLFVIETGQPDYIIFSGKGYGHGIGLCQTGARALASSPYNYSYEQILSHYFPGTQLGVVDRIGTSTASRGKSARKVSKKSR